MPPSQRAVVAQQVMQRLRPPPLGGGGGAVDGPEIPNLVDEAERLLADPKQGGRVWDRLATAMASAVSERRERAALARLARRGLISLSQMPITFRSSQYRRFAGLARRAHIERAIRNADRQEVFGSERAFVLFLQEWSPGRLLLVGATITPTGLVFEWAWRLEGATAEMTALAALRKVVEVAGVPFTMNGGLPTSFIEHDVISTLDNSITVEVRPHFPTHFFTSFHVRGTSLGLTEITLGFVVDLERYALFAAPFLGGIHEARRRVLTARPVDAEDDLPETRVSGWLH